MSARGFAAVAVATALAACSVGPEYVRPPVEIGIDSFKEAGGWRPAFPRDEVDRGPWWSIYRDRELERLLVQVDVSNQNLKAAEAAYRQSQALARQSRGALFPTVGVVGGVQQSQVAGGALGAGAQRTQISLSGAVDWEIDLWGRLRRSLETDVALAQASAADVAAARLSAQADLAASYFALRIADEQRRLFEGTVAAFTRSLAIVRNQYESGTASRTELLQAQTQLESARAQLIDVGLRRAQQEHAIAVLVGKAPSDFALPPGYLIDTIPSVEAGIPSALLERRPDIASAERQMAAANARVGAAVASYFPDLTLGGSLGLVSTALNTLFNAGSLIWAVGPQLALTLFDGGQRQAQADAARAAHERSVAIYRQTVLTAFQQVEDQIAALRILEAEARVQAGAVAAAQEAERLALNQYQAGTIPFTQVVLTQTAALTARQTALSIRLARLQASVSLVRYLGGGWRATDLPKRADAMRPAAPPAKP